MKRLALCLEQYVEGMSIWLLLLLSDSGMMEPSPPCRLEEKTLKETPQTVSVRQGRGGERLEGAEGGRC